jgi:hypothetical protein
VVHSRVSGQPDCVHQTAVLCTCCLCAYQLKPVAECT